MAGRTMPDTRRPRVVIVGAGFAGLAAARALARRPWRAEVTVIDQHNHHTFSPFLYQVATGQAEPSAAAFSVRLLARKLGGTRFRLATVTGLNVTRRLVETDRGPVGYDYLILAAGAISNDAAAPAVAPDALRVSGIGGALAVRDRLLGCFEAAAWAAGAQRSRLLTFAIVGGGPTGVELANALAAAARQLTGRVFPGIGPGQVTIVLAEAAATLLGSFPASLRAAANASLRAAGVQIRTGAQVSAADENGITLTGGERIDAATVLWAAGVRASPLAGALPGTGSAGRVIVGDTLQVERHPEIFAAGDIAQLRGPAGPLPMLAQAAIQSGAHAARSVLRLSAGRRPRPFRCRDLAVTGGQLSQLSQLSSLRLNGAAGWLAWLGLHIARSAGPAAGARLAGDWVAGCLLGRRPVPLITGPGRPAPAARGTAEPAGTGAACAGGAMAPGTSAPEPATARVPARPARADLPSVNVANANRWGRAAALAWWGQSYPGLRAEPPKLSGRAAQRARMQRLRHGLTGDKSQTRDNYRG